MPKFKDIIKEYVKNVYNENDKRIMVAALNILNASDIISENELDILKEIFMALKEDYTLTIKQDRETFNFMIVISEQNVPVIENKHDINVLYHELQKNSNPLERTRLEDAILTFFDACEHIEEDEVLVINKAIQYITNNWSLGPIEEKETKNGLVRCTHIIPSYNKRLVKKINTYEN